MTNELSNKLNIYIYRAGSHLSVKADDRAETAGYPESKTAKALRRELARQLAKGGQDDGNHSRGVFSEPRGNGQIRQEVRQRRVKCCTQEQTKAEAGCCVG